MTRPRVSLLLPTRGRPGMLHRAVTTARQQATEPDRVQFMLAVDPDDTATWTELHRWSINPRWPTRVEFWSPPARLGYNKLHTYYNKLAEKATGDWLLLYNDDAYFTTYGWDVALDQLPGHVIVGDYPNDLSPEFVCFPAVRRDVYETAGWYAPETPHVDSVWQDIARWLGRVYPVYGQYIKHDRPDISGRTPDATYLEGRAGLDHHGYFSGPFQQMLRETADRIRAALPPHPDDVPPQPGPS